MLKRLICWLRIHNWEVIDSDITNDGFLYTKFKCRWCGEIDHQTDYGGW